MANRSWGTPSFSEHGPPKRQAGCGRWIVKSRGTGADPVARSGASGRGDLRNGSARHACHTNAASVEPLEPVGIQVSEFNEGQRALYEEIIQTYLGTLPEALPRPRSQKLPRQEPQRSRLGGQAVWSRCSVTTIASRARRSCWNSTIPAMGRPTSTASGATLPMILEDIAN